MADLNDTYVVHTATTTCSMGMRSSCAVLGNTHGVYLRQQPQMTVNDSLPMINVMCFGGCYSMENPSTQAAAAAMQAAVLAACPNTFLDKVMNFFTGGKKKAQTQAAQEGVPRVVGVCTPTIPPGTKWDNGKDGVETKGQSPLLGGAKLRCLFGGEIQIVDSGQVEGEGSAELYSNEGEEGAETSGGEAGRTQGQQAEGASEQPSFMVGGVEYKEGPPATPQIEFDNDYPYDPDFEPTTDDYLNFAKWRAKLTGANLLMYLPDGCKTYSHYLSGNGETISVDYEKAYRQDSGVRESVDVKINEGIAAAVQYYNSSGKTDFSLTGGPTTSTEYPVTENWQKAIGGHTQWNSMDVSVKDNKMSIDLSVHELDRYNFDKGKSDIKTNAPDDENGRFASAGWAHPFNTESELHRKIEIDLSTPAENINMDSDNVEVTQKWTTKIRAPWEGDER